MQGKFINAEFSCGRWNGDDAKQLGEPLRVVLFRMSTFLHPSLLRNVIFFQMAS